MYYVYFIKSKKYNENYIGSTNNLRRRLAEHNDGTESSTKRYRPWRMVYYEAYGSEEDARERERKLKHHGNAVRELKKRIQRSLKNGAGFTLTEFLVAITIFILVIGAVYSSYLLSERAFREGEVAAELTQNGRVILERMVREIRQTREIVTELPTDPANATSTLEFEDGNIEERYHYIYYFKEDGEIKRGVKRYYFSGDPNTFIVWDAIAPAGEELLSVVTQEPQVIGEFVNDLKFWMPEIRLINIFIILERKGKQVDFSTQIFGRNL